MPSQKVMKAEILEWCAATHVSIQKTRHNMAARYPVIALALARQNENPTLQAISETIDRGEFLEKAIAGIVGVSPSAVRHLKNVAPKTITDAWIGCLVELFWAMDVLHPLGSPQTPKEWSLLRKLWINTGLEKHESYLTAAGVGRKRQMVLEYLFRGLCAQGYGETTQVLADRLVAALPCTETDSEYIWPFECYVAFALLAMTPAFHRRRRGVRGAAKLLLPLRLFDGAERLLFLRYSPAELIRQWESWRWIVAAHGKGGFEFVTCKDGIHKTQRAMRTVMADFDETVQWLSHHSM